MKNFDTFNDRKSAQAVAYFLHLGGGSMHLVKLMKLLYLAERRSLKEYGESITGDTFVSMKHGPVLSITYQYMNGDIVSSTKGGWTSLISDRANHELALKFKLDDPETQLIALSDSDAQCIRETWNEFGSMETWELRDYTHSGACPEWEDPGQSMRPIPLARILNHLGYSPEQVSALTEKFHNQRYLNSSLN